MATKYTLYYGEKTWQLGESEALVIRKTIEIACSTGRSAFVDFDVDPGAREDSASAVVDHLTLVISPYIPVVLQTGVETEDPDMLR
jgi:hypothetical protein